MAFGAGLITEDRRRRIHTAREVSENARRLKSSRQYHSSGLSVATTFEEQVESYCEYGPWKRRVLDPDWNEAAPTSASPTKLKQVEPIPSLDVPELTSTEARQSWRFDDAETTKEISGRFAVLRKSSKYHQSLLPPKIQKLPIEKVLNPRDSSNYRPSNLLRENIESKSFLQAQLATQISIILNNGSSAEVIDSAATAFRLAFTGDLIIGIISIELLDVCIRLAQTCDRYGRLDAFIPVLRTILSHGLPVSEECFYNRLPGNIVAQLLEQSGYRHADQQVVTSLSELKLAVAIFTAQACGMPKPLLTVMRNIGLHLCTATLGAELYKLTQDICGLLLNARTDFTAPEVECLILAEHGMALWGQVLVHFSQYFSKTLPNQDQLYAVVSAAIDSALELKKFDKGEDVLSTASQIAKNCNLSISTTWHLRVLGEHWRTTRDLASTQALFDRLEIFIPYTSRPQAMYSAIIQFCVESGRESEAQQYLERLKQACGGETIDLRTHGHLALAKAMREDWDGVEADFHFMKSLANGSTAEYSNTFVPILKLFVARHDVTKSEDFVRLYVENLDVVPNQYMFNIMVDTYCRAGELRSIPGWVEYVRPLGLRVNAVTINTILSRCRQKWDMHFDDLLRLCKEIAKIDDSMIDCTTFEILRSRAIASSNPQEAITLLKSSGLKSPAGVSISDKLRGDMREALAKGRPKKALDLYKYALRKEIPISPKFLVEAVKASIRCAMDGNLTSTIELLSQGRSRGLDIVPAMTQLLLHQVETLNCDSEDLVSFVEHTLGELQKGGLDVTLSIASKVTSILIDRGSPEQAILFWNTLASHEGIAREQIDLVILTVLLRAYIMLSDMTGIKWIMTVLTQNRITPDAHFKQLLKSARRQARKFVDAQPDNLDAQRRYQVLDESVRLVVSQRLQSRLRREEAKQLTLSIVEEALAEKAKTTQDESRQSKQAFYSGRSCETKDIGKLHESQVVEIAAG